MARCSFCGGSGRVRRELPNWQSEDVKCRTCNGTGIKPEMQCNVCGGTGTRWNSVEGIPVHCWSCKGTGIKL